VKEIRCPACRRSTVWEGNAFRPFCSERCKLHDLGNWALERYRVPGDTGEAMAGELHDEDDD